jgi:signal transduction histidine kinase
MRSATIRGIRPVDLGLAGVLVVLGAVMALADIETASGTVRIDSNSWLQLPVFVLAMLPVLWWRAGLTPVVLASSAVLLVHVLAFGHLVRCGAGLPLAFVLAFLSGVGPAQRRERWTALVLSVVLAGIVLVEDTAAGPEALPVVALVQIALFVIGQVVAQRAAMGRELRRRNDDLRVLRDERAALGVSDDRAHLSARLEALLDQRLSLLAAAADGGAAADPVALQALLADLEEDSRSTLSEMREIVGQLRGGEVALAPSPSVAHLDALLARHVHGGGSRLQISGEPRVLPTSVELSAYRIVEHLVTALADEPSAPVGVVMTFSDDALEILVAGSIPKGSDLRSAVARARERAVLHAGSIDLKMSRGRARVLAHLPVLDDA